METTLSELAKDSTIPSLLPPKFILPEDKRPQLSQVTSLASVPIIDLSQDLPLVVQQVSKACEEYGFFQIINHGVNGELFDRILTTLTNFFELPPEEKAGFFTTDHRQLVRLFTYHVKTGEQEKVSMWSETFSHPFDPMDDIFHLLPENPPHYREVVSKYAQEIGALMDRLLSLISLGLGLDKDYLLKRIGEKRMIRGQSNFYPPCPNPELTMGLNVHTDLNALTILRQSEGVTGLQVIKDGRWVAVDPVSNAFVINLGDQIEVLSNGRYKSVHHRAVTNRTHRRITLATFYAPFKDTVIGPIEELIDEDHPPLYRSYRYGDFMEEFFKQEGTRRMVKEVFRIQ